MAFSFTKIFWNKLTLYFQENDSYKDINGRGLLERFLSVFSDELEEDTNTLLKAVTCVVDPLTNSPEVLDENMENKFLTDISIGLGTVPDVFGDEELYSRLLSYVISLYKIKGTVLSYQKWANLLGLSINLIEVPNKNVLYDSGFTYDSVLTESFGLKNVSYDQFCEVCSNYFVLFSNLSDDCNNNTFNQPDAETVEKLRELVAFNEPINAKLQGFMYEARFCEQIPSCMPETIEFKVFINNAYDNNLDYDNSESYDNTTISSMVTINETCPIQGPEFNNEQFSTQEYNT